MKSLVITRILRFKISLKQKKILAKSILENFQDHDFILSVNIF